MVNVSVALRRKKKKKLLLQISDTDDLAVNASWVWKIGESAQHLR